jgi:hypothetical protein
MRKIWVIGASLGISLAIAGCSDAPSRKYFDTAGLRAPPMIDVEDPGALGRMRKMPDISEGNGCAVRNRYDVEELGGVQFSQAATLNGGMVKPVHDWLEHTVQKAAEDRFGERVTAVTIAASYACRPRNNVRGAKMSEHGYGNALDISSFTLESGRQISVLDDYYSWGKAGKFLKTVREDACADFATVLGPGSDRAHRNHIHLDLQNRRSGKSYCR